MKQKEIVEYLKTGTYEITRTRIGHQTDNTILNKKNSLFAEAVLTHRQLVSLYEKELIYLHRHNEKIEHYGKWLTVVYDTYRYKDEKATDNL